MPCFVRMSPVMYMIFINAIYMLMVFPITELICYLMRNYTSINPLYHYDISRLIYLALLLACLPLYFLTFYISWRKNRAKPLFTPKWKISNDLEEEDFMCTICYDLVVEPHTLRCQHSFCKKCINQCLRLTRKCPSCQQWVYFCSSNKLMKEKLLKWVKEQGREEEYAEIVELKHTMRVEKVPWLSNFFGIVQPFFEIPEPQPIRLRPIRQAAVETSNRSEPIPLVVHIVDEYESSPSNTSVAIPSETVPNQPVQSQSTIDI